MTTIRRNMRGIYFWLCCIAAPAIFAQKSDTLYAPSFDCCRPDGHAPAGIMTDCIHAKGEWSFAYSFMNMEMQGNQSGTKAISDDQVYTNYMMAPAKMKMQMHMLMGMYGISDRLTLMAMLNYNATAMSMHMMPAQNMMMSMPGMSMTDYSSMPTSMRSSGPGDTRLYALYNLLRSCRHRLIVSAGLSLPTGTVSAMGATMQSPHDVLPYCMQQGTGTYNLLPGVLYAGQSARFSWGATVNANLKMGVNSRNYCWGNEYSTSSWAAYKFISWGSIALRAEAYKMEKLYGYDKQINQSSLNDPTANVSNYGTQRIMAYGGINIYVPPSILRGSRVMLEYGIPAWQKVEGIQMPVKSMLTARLQYSFN